MCVKKFNVTSILEKNLATKQAARAGTVGDQVQRPCTIRTSDGSFPGNEGRVQRETHINCLFAKQCRFEVTGALRRASSLGSQHGLPLSCRVLPHTVLS